MEFKNDNGALVFKRNGETVRIEGWGKDSLRIRSTMLRSFTDHDWALSDKPDTTDTEVSLFEKEHKAGDGTIVKKQYASILNSYPNFLWQEHK